MQMLERCGQLHTFTEQQQQQAPCGRQGGKNRLSPFPGFMS